MASRDLLSVVWGETSFATSRNATTESLARLHAVVAKLAMAANRSGLDGQLSRAAAPRADNVVGLDAYQAMQATVNAVESNTWTSATPLPERAALWEVTEAGFPRHDRPLPAGAEWITTPGVASGGDFRVGEGGRQRTYRLFESPEPPGSRELPYISGFTGSGLLVTAPVRRWYVNPNWWIGIGSGALFFVALFSILWTASSFGQAYDLLAGRQPAEFPAFVEAVAIPECPATATGATCLSAAASKALPQRNDEMARIGSTCVARLEAWGGDIKKARGPDQAADDAGCHRLVGEAVKFASRKLIIQGDGWLSRAFQAAGAWLFGWHVPAGIPTISLGVPMALMMTGVLGLLVALGLGLTGKPLGALISPEGRYSLALAQVTFWTVLVLTSLVAISTFNGGLVSEHLRGLEPAAAQALSIFPEIPNEIWGIMGITFASPIISTFIKSLKPPAQPDQDAALTDGGAKPRTSGIVRGNRVRASIADWFLGEEGANLDRIDISRVQMVLITAGLIVTYGNDIFAFTRDLTSAEMFATIAEPSVVIKTLPPVGATMASLLAMSHVTYLVSKASDKPALADRKAQPIS